jgi:hypothetical protein
MAERKNERESCGLLGYYMASCGNFLRRFGTTYWSHLHGSRVRVGKLEIKMREKGFAEELKEGLNSIKLTFVWLNEQD